MIVAAVLSVLMGVVLGLLGGGGSILTLPILLYAVGIGAKQAIATSLVVVGVTSLVGAMHHARMGNVRWKTGLVFGAAGMVGAYGGGLGAGYIDGDVLLMLFAGLMIVSAVAMMRGRKAPDDAAGTADATPARPFQPLKVVVEGLVVGAVTGLVGAGGGFLVVPALVLFGGLGMRAAVGTSLLVIALKSFAGVAGHLSHATIDWNLALVVTGAAVVGALVGAALSSRAKPELLRRAFAVLVLVMAVYIVHREAPADLLESLSIEAWQLWAVGVAVALGAVAFLRRRGGRFGISARFVDASMAARTAANTDEESRRAA